MYCSQCGRENTQDAAFCAGCGAALRRVEAPAADGPYAQGKSPGLALIMSLLIVGFGQFYNGDMKKGFLMLLGAVIGGLASYSLLWWVFAIWSAVDAHRVASRKIPLWT